MNIKRHLNQGPRIPLGQVQREPVYWLVGVRRKGGVISFQAYQRNCGNSSSNIKGDDQVKKSEILSTDVLLEGGPICSSDEMPVMGIERRNRVVPVDVRVNFERRMSP